jgi:flagellar basal body rod protein FlgB
MTVSLDPMIGKLQDVLDLRMQQHALTASNLANADTPGYKAKVVDFGQVLGQVMGESPHEVARMQSNALMYNALAQGLDHKLNLLRFVVSDGRV